MSAHMPAIRGPTSRLPKQATTGRDLAMTQKAACTCEERKAAHEYSDCEIHVACDVWCGALEQPRTLAEVRAALDHWRDHGYLSGCSHGN